ncbi:hypothetical protein TEA_024937 [Camellia sinensis var. sinensis]|uniref:Bromo domain-containing protein n=1 Tax=Camellia sinensis var. sinensis TaxID=542762 RepID=A0A4S4EYX4_CAMSN|nr:hypothetical protein TEA_024937 [Camellia sinensis var. sinensis]
MLDSDESTDGIASTRSSAILGRLSGGRRRSLEVWIRGEAEGGSSVQLVVIMGVRREQVFIPMLVYGDGWERLALVLEGFKMENGWGKQSAGLKGKIVIVKEAPLKAFPGKVVSDKDFAKPCTEVGDGTSIILSDNVGQLYILSTGQGESQKDAKYDQFFLGDYRPLVQDTHGNALDQETQLAPYRRNMQDLLCMIPYTEPYQSMYQQRRLGALGIEWRPSSVRFAVGADVTLDQDYQMLPIPDLDLLIDPLPEFVDAMDWEPEIDVQSEDTDSEYNVAEELSSGGEQRSLNSNSSGDPECSSEESGDEDTHNDVLRRSKRKKQKAEVEIMTSSGRRVKRKNLDEYDGNTQRNNQRRKSRHGRKASKKKSSSLKSSRPQRAAARNALTLFSRITGVSTDGEDEDGSEGDSSESESILQDSSIDSEESDKSLQHKQHEHSKGKEICVDESEDVVKTHECSEPPLNAGNRKRLVLKLPVRDLNKSVSAGNTFLECDKKPVLVGSSSKFPQEANEVNQIYSQDPDYSSGGQRGEHAKVEHRLELFERYDRKIKWGGFKVRTSKRLKMGEPLPVTAYAGSSLCLQDHAKIENVASGHPTLEKECGKIYSSLETQQHGGQTDDLVCMNQKHAENGSTEDLDGGRNGIENSSFDEHGDYDELEKQDYEFVVDTTTSLSYTNGIENPPELKENLTPISTKFRIRSKRISKHDESCKAKIESFMEDGRNGGSHALSESPDMKQNLNSEVPDYDDAVGPSSDHGVQEGLVKSVAQIDSTSMSALQDSHKSNSHDKMYNAVYRRSKSSKARSNPEGDSGGVANTSNVNNRNLDVGVDFSEATPNVVRRTRSMGLKATTHDANAMGCNIKLREDDDGSKDASASVQKSSISACNERPYEEWASGSRVSVGLRSTRNRRSSYHIRDTSPPDRRTSKSHQPGRNSWLMLSTHEEGSRYIPQLEDEVVYLRQGHLEYFSHSGEKDVGPWKTIKGNVRAVEFCRVMALKYSTRPSGESCCKMTLLFVDSSSSVDGKSFTLTLPEVRGFPDFLVERSRYDAAIQRNWAFRDKCKVWWRNEGEENGSWWEGRIVTVKPKSPEFPDSPWEKYAVQYKSDPTETLLHSPWELHDSETQWEPPRINDEIRDKLLCSFEELEESGCEDQDRYGIRKMKQVSQKTKFVNRFPVPLTLEVIQSRLENNYYRNLEAMKHDISVMLSNAESYFERKADLTTKMRRLSDWFTRTLSSL